MGFRERHPHGRKRARLAPEFAGARRLGEVVVNVLREEFGGGVAAGELRQVIEIAIVERASTDLSTAWARPISTTMPC